MPRNPHDNDRRNPPYTTPNAHTGMPDTDGLVRGVIRSTAHKPHGCRRNAWQRAKRRFVTPRTPRAEGCCDGFRCHCVHQQEDGSNVAMNCSPHVPSHIKINGPMIRPNTRQTVAGIDIPLAFNMIER